jgi:hypothetical protein
MPSRRLIRLACFFLGLGLAACLPAASLAASGPDSLPARGGASGVHDGRNSQGIDVPAPASLREAAVGPAQTLARGLLFVYQRGAAPSKGQACPMYPSCSEYARLAVLRHGVLRGVLMAADRLHRCGHDLRYYPRVADADGWLKARDEP